MNNQDEIKLNIGQLVRKKRDLDTLWEIIEVRYHAGLGRHIYYLNTTEDSGNFYLYDELEVMKIKKTQ
jgi:hypothetical protein